ncbi:MAG: Dinitrogenase iron-molybdenum cofactor biosynthesis [Candidatus Ozemobacter sibiricus]|jgi:predicted Fe-Mo cluster-binding NifX family protein|uniref:Dinitrogenase iron-molybdenum cofactor biosynthesis n=1 Tax=Candidatus Ozemobacter sibiricus TaxID=2268124 RepID=A0A367ZSF3_9BACT|nr:MAG: Dinitrogenase iron-molybdenum cofactor biosynthesis [Candidatus Ozemobacter sibiricus]
MIIAIPVANQVLSGHFGHCDEFAFIEVDDQTRKIIKEQREQPPEHQPGVLPTWLIQHRTTVAIVGGMGTRARQMLEQAGVQVIMGAPTLPPARLAEEYLAGRLASGDNACDHGPDHVCAGHGVGHGPGAGHGHGPGHGRKAGG